MLEKIREKWNKRVKEQEARDIEYTRKHRESVLIVWAICNIIMFSFLTCMVITYPVTILIVAFAIPPICYYEKTIFGTYRKAFPKLN